MGPCKLGVHGKLGTAQGAYSYKLKRMLGGVQAKQMSCSLSFLWPMHMTHMHFTSARVQSSQGETTFRLLGLACSPFRL